MYLDKAMLFWPYQDHAIQVAINSLCCTCEMKTSKVARSRVHLTSKVLIQFRAPEPQSITRNSMLLIAIKHSVVQDCVQVPRKFEFWPKCLLEVRVTRFRLNFFLCPVERWSVITVWTRWVWLSVTHPAMHHFLELNRDSVHWFESVWTCAHYLMSLTLLGGHSISMLLFVSIAPRKVKPVLHWLHSRSTSSSHVGPS